MKESPQNNPFLLASWTWVSNMWYSPTINTLQTKSAAKTNPNPRNSRDTLAFFLTFIIFTPYAQGIRENFPWFLPYEIPGKRRTNPSNKYIISPVTIGKIQELKNDSPITPKTHSNQVRWLEDSLANKSATSTTRTSHWKTNRCYLVFHFSNEKKSAPGLSTQPTFLELL